MAITNYVRLEGFTSIHWKPNATEWLETCSERGLAQKKKVF